MDKEELEKAFAEILRRKRLNGLDPINVDYCSGYENSITEGRDYEANIQSIQDDSRVAFTPAEEMSTGHTYTYKEELDDTTAVTFDEEGVDVEDLTITGGMVQPAAEDRKKRKRIPLKDLIFTKKTLSGLSLILIAFVVLLVIASIFRSERPQISDEDLLQNQLDSSRANISGSTENPVTLDASAAHLPTGEICNENDECQSGICDGISLPYTCQPKSAGCQKCNNGSTEGSKQAVGDSCSGNLDCSSGVCYGFANDKDGICTDGSIGSSCSSRSDCENNRCVQGSCAAKQMVGGSCGSNEECASGICIGWSDQISGICLDTSEDNRCSSGADCTHGSCKGGFCKNFLLLRGYVCTENSDCLSNDCELVAAKSARLCN